MPQAELGPLEGFPENEPTKASGGGRDFVVVRRGEGAFVLDHECQHLGASLSKGTVVGETLVCPWHRAVFELSTGARAEPPGFDCQRAYETSVEGGVLSVSWDEEDEVHPSPAATPLGGDDRTFVVLGAGAAGLEAVQTLRQEGFGGDLVLIDRERHSPYDRTKLSKGPTEEAAELRLRGDAWLELHDVQLRRGEVTGVDLAARTVAFESGDPITADGLIVATGAEPNRLDLPGADLPRVLTLRSVEDAVALTAAAKGTKRAAIIGSGFIGMEAATVLSGQGIKTTVIARDEVPFAGLLGERVGQRLKREQEEAGVAFLGGKSVTEIEGEESPRAVLCEDGTRVDADLVVMAVGVTPRTSLLSGVEPDEDGGVTVGADLSLEDIEGVRLAGDVARVPTAWGEIRVEHWRWAQQLGRLAARSLMGTQAAYDGAPFFWSKQQANGSYVYIGHAEGWDDIEYDGEPDQGDDFAAYYVKDGRVTAVFGHGMADQLSRIERLMAAKGPVALAEARREAALI